MLNRYGWIAGALLGAAVLSVSSANATTIYQSDFNANSTGLDKTPSGWTLEPSPPSGGGDVDIINTPSFYNFIPGAGILIDLNGSVNEYGGMYIPIALTAGDYTVDFVLAGTQGGGFSGATGGPSEGSGDTTTKTTYATFGSSTSMVSLAYNSPLTTYSFTFDPATSGTYDLAFYMGLGEGNPNVGNLLQSVTVVTGNSGLTTPLPSTWSMLLAGFVGLGFIAYRGRRNSSGVAA